MFINQICQIWNKGRNIRICKGKVEVHKEREVDALSHRSGSERKAVFGEL